MSLTSFPTPLFSCNRRRGGSTAHRILLAEAAHAVAAGGGRFTLSWEQQAILAALELQRHFPDDARQPTVALLRIRAQRSACAKPIGAEMG